MTGSFPFSFLLHDLHLSNEFTYFHVSINISIHYILIVLLFLLEIRQFPNILRKFFLKEFFFLQILHSLIQFLTTVFIIHSTLYFFNHHILLLVNLALLCIAAHLPFLVSLIKLLHFNSPCFSQLLL
jgi:hypothetical protein